jgi:steroid delta-isomerase-like uncharacterized protein
LDAIIIAKVVPIAPAIVLQNAAKNAGESVMASDHMDDRMAARLELVGEHIRLENQHDLDGIMGTFGATARYDDEPLDAHYSGRDEVRSYYENLLQALPGLHLDVRHRHASNTAIVLEVIIRGRHLGPWRGLPATGCQIEIPLCGIFTFDEEDRLAGERIYYDRATLFRQLGLFHEPDSAAGRIGTMLMHPLTMARVATRRLWKQD